MTRRPPAKRTERRSTFRKIQEDFGEESPSEDDGDFQSVSTDNQATNYELEFTGQSLKRPGSKATPKQATPLKSSLKKSAPQAGPSQRVTRTTPRHSSLRGEQSASSPRASSRVHFSEISEQSDTEQTPTETPRRGSRKVSASPPKNQRRSVEKPHKSKQANPSEGNSRRKQKLPKKKTKLLNEIRRLQQSTERLIPKLPFARVIREILMQETEQGMRITLVALEALHESAELYLVQLFEDAYRCTIHRNRATLSVKDIDLVRFLRGPADPGNIH